MRGDLELPVAGAADDVAVDADKVILHLVEHRPRPGVSAGGNLRLLGSANPLDGVVVRAAAFGALEPGRPLLAFFRKELPFVHSGSVHENDEAGFAVGARPLPSRR